MATNLNLANFFQTLEQWGLTDILLPFLLVFTIIFAVLQKSHILGEHRKNFNVIVALVLGLSVVFPHVTNSYPINYDPVDIINGVLPSVSLLVVAVVMLLIILGVFAHDKVMLGLTAPGWIGLFAVLAIIFIFGASAGWWGGNVLSALEQFFGTDAVAIFIMILVFAIIISFITSDESGAKANLEGLGFYVDKLFGGKK